MNTDMHGDKAMAGNTGNDGGRRGRRWRIAVWAAVVALILLVPLVAMQFTEEVNWNLFDFAFMGTLLFGTGLAYELVARKAGTIAYRAAVGVALAAAFLLVWVNGAVGIIGNESNPANLMYFGVLAVGIIGALIARFQPHGMARTLFAMALAQALVPVIALIIWPPHVTSWGAAGVFGVFILDATSVSGRPNGQILLCISCQGLCCPETGPQSKATHPDLESRVRIGFEMFARA